MRIIKWFQRKARQSIGLRSENPSISLNSDESFDLLAGNSKFPKFGAIWKAVSLLSDDLAKLPLDTYEKTEDGRKKIHNELSRLLLFEPNPQQTAYIFKQNIMSSAVYYGNGYAYIERDRMFRPKYLWPLDQSNVDPIRVNGKTWYIVSDNSGHQSRLESFEVLHIRGMGDDLVGWSVMKLAQESFNLAQMSLKYGVKFYENSAALKIVLETDKSLSDEAQNRLIGNFKKMHQGLDNAHKTAVLEEGLKAHVLSMNARDAMMIESMKFAITDIANWFKIPPHKVGDASRAAYNSLEQENMSYLGESLDPWLVNWEQESRKKLLTEDEKDEDHLYFEFNRGALIRADLNTRAEFYAKALAGAPWLTVDEVRAMENRNSLGFDTLLLPTNNFGNPEPADENRTLDAAQAAMDHVKTRMVKRLRKDFESSVRNGEQQIWFDSFEAKHGEIVRREIDSVANVITAITGEEDVAGRVVSEIMEVIKCH